MRAAYLYRVLADVEQEPLRAGLFSKLAGEAERQAKIWASGAVQRGLPIPTAFRPDQRTGVVAHLTRRWGLARCAPSLPR